MDALPAALQQRLPRSLGFDPAVLAEPDRALFHDLLAGDSEEVLARLDAAGVDRTGAILDVGGGPGHVAVALARAARRVVLTDFARHVIPFARGMGVEAERFDFAGDPLSDVVVGLFDLILSRYGLNYAADLPKIARGLAAVAAPGATLLLDGFVVPTRGACLVSALEDAGPVSLWQPDHVARTFATAGWREVRRYEPDPPMPFWEPHRVGFREASLPWWLARGPLPRDPMQRHAGIAFRAAG